MAPEPAEARARCRRMARQLRRRIIERSLAASVGHVGSALCVADVMAVLWEGVLLGAGSAQPDRDRFILGKGHAALALYGVLHAKGLIDEATFATYCQDGSWLGVHPEARLPGVDASTGSLGQSLSIGCGLALAARWRGRASRTYVLISDGECNEGQVWEAALFAGHHRLSELCAIVDWNGMQALGRTRDILGLDDPLAPWRGFGWTGLEVDGHDVGALLEALERRHRSPGPLVVIARTVLGKGVSFMEDRLEWHYRNLTPELAQRALDELALEDSS